ncbi:permease (plasmid) [Legionella adelaidensis]|uniref:Lipopolysaccharide export system permease protein LptF n=1 Tax=Legionella adelaidensis TaxID=45056 RepID=A0A0W0R321_9GAMM|nr:LPS export ABC transporter permease LptF [Legionella adelaidensis]KTC65418.1 LPS export ABC transporter permease LptF [Legionella adelaidensis]VEH84760.1 permease [Legionella adelaidensis]
MIIFRYLAKEVFVTLAALTTILLLIFMSNQFVRYLNRAASGQIPAMFIMKLMALELPNLIGLLLPLGFYVALLVAYGRLYAESEMTVLQACGYSPGKLLRHSFYLASFVALVVTVLMIWVSPYIAIERAKLLKTTGIKTLIQTIVPERFNEIPGGQVYYVESMNRAHTVAKNIFLAKIEEKEGKAQWNIIRAEKGYAHTDAGTREDYVNFQKGKAYQGVPGASDFQVAEFENYKARLPHPVMGGKNDIRTASTASLLPLNNPDHKKAAELQWRLAVPIMIFTLTLVGVPLSRVNPRSGKFAKILPAIVLYIIYANFIFVAKDWIIDGKMPTWIGMWGLHLAVAILGIGLIKRNQVKPA